MFTSIADMVKALADFGRSLSEKFKTDKEKQSETVVIQDRKDLKEATDLAEQIHWQMREYFAMDSQFTMWLARLFYDSLNKDEKRLFKRFYKQKSKIEKSIEKLQKEFEKVN
ncbi:MAG: hypothetical protein ACI37T_05195 [Candidatus Gastranaerophilaceae bacterium]